MCKFSKPIYRRLLKLYTFRVSLYAHVYILTGGQPKPRGEVHEDLFSQRDYQRFSLKCSPYGDRGGPLALQQLARHFPHFGLGRLATNTRHQDLLPNYKESGGLKSWAKTIKTLRLRRKHGLSLLHLCICMCLIAISHQF